MNLQELMDKVIAEANESAAAVKKKTGRYSMADAEKIRKFGELVSGYLEAMTVLSWKKEEDEKTRSQIVSAMQIIEEITAKQLEKAGRTRDYKVSGRLVGEYYGRVKSVLKKISFKELDELAQQSH